MEQKKGSNVSFLAICAMVDFIPRSDPPPLPVHDKFSKPSWFGRSAARCLPPGLAPSKANPSMPRKPGGLDCSRLAGDPGFKLAKRCLEQEHRHGTAKFPLIVVRPASAAVGSNRDLPETRGHLAPGLK
jgi:hypothetical protein